MHFCAVIVIVLLRPSLVITTSITLLVQIMIQSLIHLLSHKQHYMQYVDGVDCRAIHDLNLRSEKG